MPGWLRRPPAGCGQRAAKRRVDRGARGVTGGSPRGPPTCHAPCGCPFPPKRFLGGLDPTPTPLPPSTLAPHGVRPTSWGGTGGLVRGCSKVGALSPNPTSAPSGPPRPAVIVLSVVVEGSTFPPPPRAARGLPPISLRLIDFSLFPTYTSLIVRFHLWNTSSLEGLVGSCFDWKLSPALSGGSKCVEPPYESQYPCFQSEGLRHYSRWCSLCKI